MTFTLPTRAALLEHRRRQIEDGYLFPLAATSIGMTETLHARVRRLSTTERASVELLPQSIQETVWAGLKEAQKLQKQSEELGEAQSLIEAATKSTSQLAAANAWCIASFIEPALVANESELATKPGAYVVDDIAAEDRISFFYACIDADSGSAKQMKLFRPKPADAVPDSSPVGLVTHPTFGTPEHAS